MGLEKHTTVYAVRVEQPTHPDGRYWIPQLYAELQQGNARFGWGKTDNDMRYIKTKMDKTKMDNVGWENLTENEHNAWKHAAFLLGVRPDDYFVYINMPEYGKCTIVKIKDIYQFDDIWDTNRQDEFRHVLPCEFIATFHRRADMVPQRLQTYLCLRGAKNRIPTRVEFEALLTSIQNSEQRKSPKERLRQEIDTWLDQISDEYIENLALSIIQHK